MKKVLGEEHPNTLHTMHNLAVTYDSQGRYKEAEALQVGVLELRKKVLEEEHPETLDSLYNLAWYRKALDQDQDAIQLLQRAVDLHAKKFGSDHPENIEWTRRSEGASYNLEMCMSPKLICEFHNRF